MNRGCRSSVAISRRASYGYVHPIFEWLSIIPITLLVLPLGSDASRVYYSAPERYAVYRALASSHPVEHIHGSLCQTHGDIGRGANSRVPSWRSFVAARSAAG